MIGKFFQHHYSFFFSQANFILRVSPLRNRHQPNKKEYFPPPGYGIPAGEKAQFNHPEALTKVASYGFYLAPGRLARDYLFVSFCLAVCLFSPLITLEVSIGGQGIAWGYCYGGAIIAYLLFLGIIYWIIYHYFMPPVLTSIWPLWPEPSYRLLQSVPHKVRLKRYDKLINIDGSSGSLYWCPKPQMPLFRQPQEYAQKTPTLQNVLLDFAIFEFFFFGKSRIQSSYDNKPPNKTEERNEVAWFYWLSPVLVNYFILVLMLPLMWILSDVYTCDEHFLIEPKQALSFSIMVWAGLTYWFMKARLLSKLTGLKNKVEQGYFARYFDLVPQQILRHMQGIPEAAHIGNYIIDLEKFLSFAMLFSVVSYIGIIDGSF